MNIGKDFVMNGLYMKGRNPEVFVTLKTWLLVIIVILLLLCHISSDSLAPSYPVFQTAIETHSRINTSILNSRINLCNNYTSSPNNTLAYLRDNFELKAYI